MISSRTCVVLLAVATILLSACAADETEYYGIIRSLPEDHIGSWRIGNRDLIIGRWTDVEEAEGEIMVGRCVRVLLDGDEVEEVVTSAMHRCIYPNKP